MLEHGGLIMVEANSPHDAEHLALIQVSLPLIQ